LVRAAASPVTRVATMPSATGGIETYQIVAEADPQGAAARDRGRTELHLSMG